MRSLRSRSRSTLPALALVLLAAGCGSPIDDLKVAGTEPVADPTPNLQASPQPDPTPTPTPRVTPTPTPAQNPAPVLARLEPATAVVGTPWLTLTVTGTGFVPGSVVRWDGAARPTSYLGPTALRIDLSAADLAAVGTVQVTVATPPPGGGTSEPKPFTISLPPGLRALAELDLPANDLLYDSRTERLYVSVPSRAGAGRGNTITVVDPTDATVERSVFVGSEPGRLALSDDGQLLYVALDGAAAVRRVEVETWTPGLQFALGRDAFFGPMYAEDIAILPGAPRTVAVSKRYSGVSPRHAGVSVYDDGVQRPASTPGHTGSNEIEAASGGTLYGLNTETTEFGLRVMTVTATGVTTTATYASAGGGFGTQMALADGLLYFSGGAVVDPSDGSLVGTYAGVAGLAVAPDVARNRVFFIGWDSYLHAFDLATFVYVSSIDLGWIDQDMRRPRLVRWGADGLAIASGEKVYLLRTTLMD